MTLPEYMKQIAIASNVLPSGAACVLESYKFLQPTPMALASTEPSELHAKQRLQRECLRQTVERIALAGASQMSPRDASKLRKRKSKKREQDKSDELSVDESTTEASLATPHDSSKDAASKKVSFKEEVSVAEIHGRYLEDQGYEPKRRHVVQITEAEVNSKQTSTASGDQDQAEEEIEEHIEEELVPSASEEPVDIANKESATSDDLMKFDDSSIDPSIEKCSASAKRAEVDETYEQNCDEVEETYGQNSDEAKETSGQKSNENLSEQKFEVETTLSEQKIIQDASPVSEDSDHSVGEKGDPKAVVGGDAPEEASSAEEADENFGSQAIASEGVYEEVRSEGVHEEERREGLFEEQKREEPDMPAEKVSEVSPSGEDMTSKCD